MVVRIGRRFTSTLLGCLFLVAAVPSIRSAQGAPPVVAGFERFGKEPKVAAGRLLLSELNCTSCHQTDGASAMTRQAPVLDQVGTRVRAGFLKKFLRDPQSVKAGTTMPHLLAGDPEREAKVEALVQFLVSTGAPKQERLDLKSINAGRNHYAKIGCIACHGTRDAKGDPEKTTAASVPLGDLRSKYTIPSLASFLENPHGVRPSGRMPALLIGTGKDKTKEARELANYLLQGLKVTFPVGKGTTTFAHYSGDFPNVPDFDKLKPNAIGIAPAFDLGASPQRSNYALKFEGVFKIENEGVYHFRVTSDDGSILWIDGKKVVDNDGIHPPTQKAGSVKLMPGLHKVTLGFTQAGGGDELEVEIAGSALAQQPFGGLVAANEAALEKLKAPFVAKDDPDQIDLQSNLVEKGKALFASEGCASCHQMKGIKSTSKAPALANLKGTGGCLSAEPVRGTPFFGLSEPQRQVLAAAIKSPVAESKSPSDLIAHAMLVFNCYACHSRDKVGGPEEDLNKFFVTSQPEMGDEARVPPPLDGVGAKIKFDYLKGILDKGSDDRPYMFTRMPAFGLKNVGPLAEALATADKGKFPVAPEVAFKETPSKIRATARHLVGGQAFGCIKCHTFGGVKAEGTQGIDMLLLPQRLNHDWFHAYLYDPQKIRPGTHALGLRQGQEHAPKSPRWNCCHPDRSDLGLPPRWQESPDSDWHEEIVDRAHSGERCDHLSQLHRGLWFAGHRRRLSREDQPDL